MTPARAAAGIEGGGILFGADAPDGGLTGNAGGVDGLGRS
jgi:hypothetical protein